MVLSKRQRNGEFVVLTPSSMDHPQMTMSQQEGPPSMTLPDAMPPAKRTRKHPPRSSKAAATSEPPAKTPPAKKGRASRAKNVSAPPPATPPVPVMPEAGPSQTAPLPKRGRKKAAAGADASGSGPEKRGAVFKPKCPQNILDRVQRVMTQRWPPWSSF